MWLVGPSTSSHLTSSPRTCSASSRRSRGESGIPASSFRQEAPNALPPVATAERDRARPTRRQRDPRRGHRHRRPATLELFPCSIATRHPATPAPHAGGSPHDPDGVWHRSPDSALQVRHVGSRQPRARWRICPGLGRFRDEQGPSRQRAPGATQPHGHRSSCRARRSLTADPARAARRWSPFWSPFSGAG